MRNIEQNKYVTTQDKHRAGEELMDGRAQALAEMVKNADPFAEFDDTA
jgi:hypothetical protein|tara:strand:+ start:2313 stop:2456 length:144 start_codon:yes stop_codon:yes gene_type:complete